jgi:hypothetical protein
VFPANHGEGLEAVKVIIDAGYEVQHVFGSTNAEKRDREMRFWGPAAGVKGCTFHSFKGCELRAVVTSAGSGDETPRHAYVALTRVKGDSANRSAFVTVVTATSFFVGFSSHRTDSVRRCGQASRSSTTTMSDVARSV